MEDSKDLVTYCLQNNRSAQRQLYDLYAPAMMGVCLRYTKTIADAEDVLQDGFVKVFTHLEQYREDGDLGAWMRRIMVNTALNFLMKNKRYDTKLLLADAKEPFTEYNVVNDLEARELMHLVRRLPDGYQLIFNLHAIEGYSHVEIGKMLGIRDSTARSQYARARATLITSINQQSKTTEISHHGAKRI